jgi:hypothetical protein
VLPDGIIAALRPRQNKSAQVGKKQ